MERELYKGDKSVIRADDLVFDGSSVVIPSYWVDTIADILYLVDQNKVNPDDLQDFKLLKSFFEDIQEFKNGNYL